MNSKLWTANHPRHIWRCEPDVSDKTWQTALVNALPALELTDVPPDTDALLSLILGEARFGPGHWTLSFPKRMYYLLKPILPRALTRALRQVYSGSEKPNPDLRWPVEPRYVNFLWEAMAQLLCMVPQHELCIKPFWPEGFSYALVLTHDIESNAGQQFVRPVADLEESLGFRSSFNFVPEGYPIDMNLIDELRQRGFEIGVHGLTHDGKLFNSRAKFERCAEKINGYLRDLGAVGFRAPLTIRHPEWMQALNIEYDLSFFDTDPFEPIPGGTMSIWPFFLGHFVELPYTLVQDYTLTDVLREETPNRWLEKVEFIRQHCGMALMNSHPDYLQSPSRFKIYSTFLRAMREKQDYWHALPRQVAGWWKERMNESPTGVDSARSMAKASLVDGALHIVYENRSLPNECAQASVISH